MRSLLFALLFCLTLFGAKPYNEQELQRIAAYKGQVPFSFAVMGDNRDGDAILEKIIQQLNRSDILFAINNGDLVSHGFSWEFEEYLEILKSSKKPIISAIGNHEIPLFFGDESNFKEYIGRPFFSFSFANSYFIFVDNANKKKVPKKQMEWLKTELQKSQKYKYRFVFLHVPLYDPRKGETQRGHSMKDLQNAKELNELFDTYHVTMLFASHIHTYLRGKWGKTPYIITGGAGAPNSRDNGFYHYIVVNVGTDGVKYILKKL